MSGSGNDHFRISVPNLKQWGYFPQKGLLPGNIITYLNINFFTASLRHKIDFFLIQLSHIDIISTTKQFHTYDIFVHPAIIHISAAKDRISNPVVTEIKLFRVFEIFLSTDIGTVSHYRTQMHCKDI